MLLFLTLSVLWTALWLAVRHGLSWWRERWFLQPAHYISDIKRVSYFRQLPESQLERLALNALTAHKYLLLGDPILGRAKVQGYAWRAGKKVVIVLRREKPPWTQVMTGQGEATSAWQIFGPLSKYGGMPLYVLIDANGVLRYAGTGGGPGLPEIAGPGGSHRGPVN